MQRVKLNEAPLPRVRLFVGLEEVSNPPEPKQLDLWVDPAVFFHDELTPWFNVVTDGQPVRPGLYQTSGDGVLPAWRPWRKYFGSNAWSLSCATPAEAERQDTSSVGRPVYFRGLTREV